MPLKLHHILYMVAAVLIVSAPSAHAKDVNNFYFEDFSADYYVTKDESGVSHMKVVENLTAIFPDYNQNLGIVRYIPSTNQDGQNITVDSASALNLSVTRNGFREPIYGIESEDGYYAVSTGDDTTYLHGRQVFTLTYEFSRVITNFDDYQELYWDTNGTGWKQKFDHLSARVHFEDSVSLIKDRVSCYVGKHGRSGAERCRIEPTDDGFAFSADNLKAGENLTFALAIAAGTFATPATWNRYFTAFAAISLVVLGLVIFLAIKYRRTTKSRRDFYKGLFVAPQYEPYKGLKVAEAGLISLKTTSDSRPATLIELAVRHKITLIKQEKSKRNRDWRIRVDSLSGLTPPERSILTIMNGGEMPEAGQEFPIKKHAANSAMQALSAQYDSQARSTLTRRHYLADKASRHGGLYATLLVIGITWPFISLLAAATISDAPGIVPGGNPTTAIVIAVGIFIVLASLITAIREHKFAYRSEEGLRAARYYEGLELYMRMAEAERLNFLQSVDGADTSPSGIVKLYEQLLPYAIIFGLETSWMAELSRYYEMDGVECGTWYAGVAIMNSHDFHSFVSTTSSEIRASTTSSSNSGSGGGGFSGGGGGGGGGGGR